MPLTASAGILDDVKDAITGHGQDAWNRVFVDETFIEGTEVAKGKFRNYDRGRDAFHWVDGSVSLIEVDGERYIQLHEDFRTGVAPDLYLYLGHHRIEHEDDFVNVTEVSPLTLGSGASYYLIPSDIEFSEVLIWCKRFHQFMGAATLEPVY